MPQARRVVPREADANLLEHGAVTENFLAEEIRKQHLRADVFDGLERVSLDRSR